ncbi:chromate efflux transporter [Corynebacterium phoceense]|uniref:chromate efflux transporter n=1 Tax=Corynebacterium phoceense TaxID=1686286 RepID=UPI000839D359|nr:chromate efflux transporter [Corynebacterium phoceense]
MSADIRRSFFPLGWTSFGGPAAHLGYFRTEFISRRGWLTESSYADLVALSQFLPGPGSSKVGMALGYHRGGWAGFIAAWFWFTLPSALIMAVCGLAFRDAQLADAHFLTGLLAAAAGVVAHAVYGMARKLLYTPLTWALAIATFVALFWLPQIVPLLLAAGLGAAFLRRPQLTGAPELRPVTARAGWSALFAFFALLGGLAAGALTGNWWATRLNAFYQAGALVFGGGHVILPLLEDRFVATGWMNPAEFFAGYSIAQGLPGPLFTFATYVGAVDRGILGAIVGTVMIFLPGALLMVAGLYFWSRWRTLPRMRGAFAGVNAAVVGLLTHALWDPIITHGVTGWATALIAVAAFAALWFKAPAWSVAVGAALAGWVLL